MGPETKETELVAYIDGEPVKIGNAIPEISIDPEAVARAVETVKEAWQQIVLDVEGVADASGEWFRMLEAKIEAKIELEVAMRWAACYNRPLYNRYRRTKKKRTRKKYAKRILSWYQKDVRQNVATDGRGGAAYLY